MKPKSNSFSPIYWIPFLLTCLLWVIGIALNQQSTEPKVITLTTDLKTVLGRGWMTDADWSPDGQTIAVTSSIGVWLYDANNLSAQPQLLPSDSAPVSSAMFSSDGRYLVEGRWDMRVYVWDMNDLSQPITILRGHQGFVNDVAIHPSGQWVASASSDKTIRLWDIETSETIHILEGHDNSVETVKFNAVDTLLGSYGRDNTVRLWDIQSGELFTTYDNPEQDLIDSLLNDDNNPIDINLPQLKKYHHPPINTLALSPDGRYLAGGTGNIFTPDNSVLVWDLTTQALYQSFDSPTNNILTLAHHPDSTVLAFGDASGQVYLWDYQADKLLRQWQAHDSEVLSMLFVDNSTLVTGSADEFIRVWNINTGQLRYEFKSPNGAVQNITIDNTTNFDQLSNTLTSYTVSEEEQQLQLLCSHGNEIGAIAFSPDNQLRATATYNHTIQLVNVSTGDIIRKFEGHTNRIEDMIFSLDSRLLASAGWDNTVYIWDAATGDTLATLTGHTRPVTSVIFSADGTQLISASDDGTVRVWILQK